MVQRTDNKLAGSWLSDRVLFELSLFPGEITTAHKVFSVPSLHSHLLRRCLGILECSIEF